LRILRQIYVNNPLKNTFLDTYYNFLQADDDGGEAPSPQGEEEAQRESSPED